MFKTLHYKLLVIITFLSILPLIVVGYISYQSQKEILTEQIENNLVTEAENLVIELEEFIAERIKDIDLLTRNPVIRDLNSSFEDVQKEFRNFLDVYDIYFGAIFVDKNGYVTVDMDNTVLGRNLGQREWFKKAIEGEIYFSDIYLSNVVNNPILALAGPVRDKNGNIIGVISPAFDLDSLWQLIDRYANQQKQLGLSGYAFLMNYKGDIIAHPDRTQILNVNWLTKNGLDIELYKEIDKSSKLYYNRSSNTMNVILPIKQMSGFTNQWFVGLTVNNDELYAPLKELLIKYLILFGLVLIVTGFAIIKLSRYIVKPVNQLVIATTDFAQGKKIKPLVLNTYEEINILNQTFNEMTKKLEQREKEHKKSTLILETTDNGVLSINKNNQVITIFNKKCEELFKIKKEEIIGKQLSEIGEQNPDIKKFIQMSSIFDTKNVKKSSGSLNNIEFETCINGQRYIFLANISILEVKENDIIEEEILIVFSDITEIRSIQEELIQSEKLKAAGQLAASITHEIRNPLTTIRGFLQLFDQNSNGTDVKSGEQYFPLIIQEIDRINDIIDEYLSLAKPNKKINIQDTDIVRILEEIFLLYESQAAQEDIRIIKKYNKIPIISMDTKQIKQVFINIIKNAFEAMPLGGALIVATNYIENEGIVSISFSDTGKGMDQQTLEKLGTPFFTTKEDGTGLGIATCYRIVEGMGGTITVESKVSEGTTFTIKLPIKINDKSH
ncbi:hypothetical protein BHF71_03075 [Vulcanibacillus modesticaldus]|uniref:histidine kinase n=1 Tax=Vulcanibacillus modesticaldus TaxID=337097 RepID=A0A1D2YTB6_9BACI|nr:sensor histidine kinase [Vulcanibacillus modesticaldus]OEF98921.1 hypothetical protein BHF71_03075 [Vulcanibacillus modesticaldus]